MTRASIALLVALVSATCSCKRPPAKVHVEAPSARVMPNGVGAFYFKVIDEDDGGDRLVSVTSTDARSCQLHETIEDGDVTSMKPAEDGFRIAPHGELALATGGKHVMVFGIADPNAPTLHATLHFERAGAVDVVIPVERTLATRKALRVCADPNNLPFSNAREEGFENRLARLMAEELDADVEYTWSPQRRGFFRNTLNAKKCDVVMGVPSTLDLARTTAPYYRSSYVFVFGPHAKPVSSLDAPELRTMKIGVPLVGDDGANPPPALALAPRNLTSNLHGYSVYSPEEGGASAELARALRRGEIDVALAWGPPGGYYAAHEAPALAVVRMPPNEAPKGTTFEFDIAMAVRRKDEALLADLNRAIARRRPAIEALLDEFHVPRRRGTSFAVTNDEGR